MSGTAAHMSGGRKDVVLVIPTIREKSFNDFISRWKAIGLFDHVDLFVMEDNPIRSFEIPTDLGCSWRHFCWEDIEKELGEKSWIIPRRSDTVRSFGYLIAAYNGYKYVLTLDDDCYPPLEEDGLQYVSGGAFVNEHIKQLEGRTKWFNTLNSVKPRGIPFYNVGKNEDVIVNHGLWTNVLDYDAPYQLANPIPEEFSFDNRIVPSGFYFPMCGMNVMWKGGATVLMYHLLMGKMVRRGEGPIDPKDGISLEKLAFDRFGDIWCGIFMKKIADLARRQVSTGMPYIRHERASNPFTNLKKEANGIEVNEKLWEYVDQFSPDGDVDTYTLAELYWLLGERIQKFTEYPEHVGYFEDLGAAMMIWAELLGADPKVI